MKRLILILFLLLIGPSHADLEKCFSNPSAGVEYTAPPANCLFLSDPRALSQAMEGGQELLNIPAQVKPALNRLGVQFYVYVRPAQGQRPSANLNLLTEELPAEIKSTAQYAKLSAPTLQQVLPGFKQLPGPKNRAIGGKPFEGMEFEGQVRGETLRFRTYFCVDEARHLAYVITFTDAAVGASRSFSILEKALSGMRFGVTGGQG